MKRPEIAMRYRGSYLGKGAAVFYRPVKAKSGMKRPEIAMRYRGSPGQSRADRRPHVHPLAYTGTYRHGNSAFALTGRPEKTIIFR